MVSSTLTFPDHNSLLLSNLFNLEPLLQKQKFSNLYILQSY